MVVPHSYQTIFLQDYYKLHIYLSPADPHILTCPISGIVTTIRKIPSKDDEERELVVIRSEDGQYIKVEQAVRILGKTGWMSKLLVSKRIIINLEEGQQVNQGDRYGIIRFGSEVKVHIPLSYNILVKKGDKCRLGETVLARKN